MVLILLGNLARFFKFETFEIISCKSLLFLAWWNMIRVNFFCCLARDCNYWDETGLYRTRQNIVFKAPGRFLRAVRVKGWMSLRNGMWHGLRNDIIMRNSIHGKWCKEINLTGKHACVIASPFLAPIWRSNRFAGPFITAFKARVKLKHSWYTK